MQGKARLSFCVALITLFVACAPAPPPPPAAPAGPTPAELKTAAEELDQKFLAAFNKGDAAALMATYWNSADLVSAGPEDTFITGFANAQASSEAMFKSMPGAKIEFLSHNNRVEGNVVLGWGTWRITIPAQPKPQVVEGRFTDVKAMKDGKMVYVMDHASVPLPPPPDAKK